MEAIEGLPFTPSGLSLMGVLGLIIIYLFRLNAIDRRDANTRLSTLETEHGVVLDRERDDRAAERVWIREWYESRISEISARYEEEVKTLRAEVGDLHQRLMDVRVTVDEERRRRHDAEEKLSGVQSDLARMKRSGRAAP